MNNSAVALLSPSVVLRQHINVDRGQTAAAVHRTTDSDRLFGDLCLKVSNY